MNFIAAAKILKAIVLKDVKDSTPCVSEYTNVMTCMRDIGNDDCFSCILDSVRALKGNITFPALVESNICYDLAECKKDRCDSSCGSQWSTLGVCAERWAEKYAEDVQVCLNLSEDETASASRPILVQDFVLPLNYTNSGFENGVQLISH